MAFVTKGFWLVLLFFGPLAFSSDLETRWQSALNSPSSNQIESWQSWIALAKSQNIQSAEAFHNLARAFWENQESARSVEALVFATQKRDSIFSSWKDLSLLSQIQQNLLNQSRLSNRWEIRMNLLKESHLKWIWILGLSWLALLTLFLRFGLRQSQILYKLTGSLWLLVFLLGFTIDLLTQKPFPYLILENGKEMIPLFSEPQPQQDKISDLPSGVLVSPMRKQNGWIFITEPIQGWFEERLSLSLPSHESKKKESSSLSVQSFSNTD